MSSDFKMNERVQHRTTGNLGTVVDNVPDAWGGILIQFDHLLEGECLRWLPVAFESITPIEELAGITCTAVQS